MDERKPVEEIMNDEQRRELNKLEVEIETASESYYCRVGTALITIRAKKLFRWDYNSFDDYLSKRWNFTRQRAQQLISAAQVAKEMGDDSGPAPSEPAARALAKVPKPKRAKVWKESIEHANGNGAAHEGNGKAPTAKVIKTVAKRVERGGWDLALPIAGKVKAKPDYQPDGTVGPAEPMGATPAAAEPAEPVEPWAEHNDAMASVAAVLRSVNGDLRRALDIQGQEIKSRWGKRLSWSGTIGQINSFIRMIEGDGMIAGEEGGQIVTVNEAKKAKDWAASKGKP